MNKDALLAALNAMQDGESAGAYHDEIETLIALITSAEDSDIVTAWEMLSTEEK